MNKIYDYIIMDCYNIAYRWANKSLKDTLNENNKTIHSEVIENFFKAYETYKNMFADSHTKIICTLDNANTLLLRKSIMPEYKANRVDVPNWFIESINLIETILAYYDNNLEFYRVKGLEADDFVPNIIKTISEHSTVLMISTDLDWSRCLSNSNIIVEQYIDKNHDIRTVDNFTKQLGFKCNYSSICFYKCFYGDVSDNIKPIMSELPKKMFDLIIDNFNSMPQFYSYLELNKIKLDVGWKLNFLRHKDDLLKAWKVINAPNMNIETLKTYKQVCKLNEQMLRVVYSNLNLSFDKRLDYTNIDNCFALTNARNKNDDSLNNYF